MQNVSNTTKNLNYGKTTHLLLSTINNNNFVGDFFSFSFYMKNCEVYKLTNS